MADFYFPPPAFYFNVSLDSKQAGDKQGIAFQEVSGLDVELETMEIKEGGINDFRHRVPVGTKYNNLVLKRGLATKDTEILDWVKTILISASNLNKRIKPRKLIVTLNNEKGEAVMTWAFENAYPVKWSLSNLNAQENAIAIETMEFSYRKFSIE